MAYIYRHIRLDKNEPFYIGISNSNDEKNKRAFSKASRSDYWKNIVLKTNYKVEILFDDLSWEDACKKEIEFIALYGRKDLGKGPLCNLTDGGEGNLNTVISLETRKKLSESNKGRKPWNKGVPVTEEVKEKLREASLGEKNHFYGKTHTEGSKEKISLSQKKNFTDEKRQVLSNIMKGNKNCLGRILSSETKEKISNSNKGNKNCLGRVISKETRQKLSEANKGISINSRGSHPKAKKVINTETGQVYSCVRDAFESQSKVNTIANFTHKLNGRCTNDTSFLYLKLETYK